MTCTSCLGYILLHSTNYISIWGFASSIVTPVWKVGTSHVPWMYGDIFFLNLFSAASCSSSERQKRPWDAVVKVTPDVLVQLLGSARCLGEWCSRSWCSCKSYNKRGMFNYMVKLWDVSMVLYFYLLVAMPFFNSIIITTWFAFDRNFLLCFSLSAAF